MPAGIDDALPLIFFSLMLPFPLHATICIPDFLFFLFVCKSLKLTSFLLASVWSPFKEFGCTMAGCKSHLISSYCKSTDTIQYEYIQVSTVLSISCSSEDFFRERLHANLLSSTSIFKGFFFLIIPDFLWVNFLFFFHFGKD